MKRRCLLATLLLGLWFAPAHATNYYADCLNGSDTANGQKPYSAWSTLAKVSTTGFKAGDVMSLRGGCVYRSNLLGYWVRSTPYTVNQLILDSNANVEQVTVSGTSGSSTPSWNATLNGTTTDGGVTWENYGPDLYALYINQWTTTQPTAPSPVTFTSYGDQPAWISGDLCAGQLTGNCGGSAVPNWVAWASAGVSGTSIYKTPWPVRPYTVYVDNEQGWPSLRAATCESGTCLSQGPGGSTAYPSNGLNPWLASTTYSTGDAVQGSGTGGNNPGTASTWTAPFWYTANGGGTSGSTGLTCTTIGSTCSDGNITWTVRGLSLGEILAMQPGSWFWDGTCLYIWMPDGSNPNTHVVEVPDKYYGIYLTSPGNDRNYFTFQNVAVRHACRGISFASAGTSGNFAGIQLLDSIVTQTGTGKADDGEFCNPVTYTQQTTASTAPTTSPLFARNVISYGGNHGGCITLQSASGALVTDNDISHCNHANINFPNVSASSPVVTNGLTIQRNIVHDSEMSDFPIGAPAPHPGTDSNEGIYGEYAENVNIDDNLIYNIFDAGACVNNGQCNGVHLYHPSGPISIRNNVILNVGSCIVEGNLGSALSGFDAQNNLCALGAGPSGQSQDFLIADLLSSPTIDHNHLTDNLAGNVANYQSANYSFSAWQGLGFDAHGTDNNYEAWLPTPLNWIFSHAQRAETLAGTNGSRNGNGGAASSPAGSSGNLQTNNGSGGFGAFSGSGPLPAHNFGNQISVSGALSGAEPAFADISGTLAASQLPNPTATTLGGTESLAATSHQWINAISTSGAPSSTEPACGDLSNSAPSCSMDATNASNISSGTLAVARMPADNSISSTNSATGTAGGTQAVIFEDAPVWLHYLGDASEADPAVFANSSCTGSGTPVACCTGSGTGTCISSQTIQGEHWYANLTVGSGSILTISNTASGSGSPTNVPRAALIVHSQGTCTIAGTIAGNAIVTGGGDGGGAGAGGGGGSSASGGNGNNSTFPGAGASISVSGGSVGGTSGNTASNVSGPTTQSQEWIADIGLIGSAFLGGGAGGAGGNSGGAAGDGGGAVILDCATINYTGSINLEGANGTAGGSSGLGGGGGGGGGFFIAAARSYTANTGTTNVSGGTGGNAGGGTSGAGGNGGNGWTKQFTLN